MLRLVTPVSLTICRPREDVELDGYRFRADSQRFAFLAVANRDPDVITDPHRSTWTARRTILPSAPARTSASARRARLHAEIALTTLVGRLPGLRLNGAPVWRGFLPLHELEHLRSPGTPCKLESPALLQWLS
jgi:cytochrome P450